MHEMNFWNVGQLFFLSVKYSLSTLLEKGMSLYMILQCYLTGKTVLMDLGPQVSKHDVCANEYKTFLNP